MYILYYIIFPTPTTEHSGSRFEKDFQGCRFGVVTAAGLRTIGIITQTIGVHMAFNGDGWKMMEDTGSSSTTSFAWFSSIFDKLDSLEKLVDLGDDSGTHMHELDAVPNL
jgi:hypothetical protein